MKTLCLIILLLLLKLLFSYEENGQGRNEELEFADEDAKEINNKSI